MGDQGTDRFTALGETIYRELRSLPFGSRTKTETDLMLFSALVDAGIVDLSAPPFQTALTLRTTPTKLQNLIYQYRLRRHDQQEDAKPPILAVIKQSRVTLDGNYITFGVEDRFLRERLLADLREHDVHADTSHNRALVRLSFDHLITYCRATTSKQWLETIEKIIKTETGVQRKDTGWYVRQILRGVGVKLAGEGAGALLDEAAPALTDFIASLFDESATGAGATAVQELLSADDLALPGSIRDAADF